jgi:hypothetical protein
VSDQKAEPFIRLTVPCFIRAIRVIRGKKTDAAQPRISRITRIESQMQTNRV